MKQRSTTPVSESFAARAAVVAAIVLIAVSSPIQISKTVYADSYDDQISAIKDEIGDYQKQAAKLSKQADTYQAAVNKLALERRQIQEQIKLSEVKRDKFNAEIKENEELIVANQEALGDTIADIYVDSEMSTLEMVASSGTISDVVDGMAQKASIQDSLNDKIDEIDRLNVELEKKKVAVEREILNSKNARNQLKEKEDEQKELARKTRGKESEYKKLAKKKNAEVESLRAAQAEQNRRELEAAAAASSSMGAGFSVPVGDPTGGGYPYTAGPLDYGVDPWGLYYRECVSYTAWKVASTGRFVPHFGGMGNANQWPSTVAKYGIRSGSEPRAGSVAMWPIGFYGHVMYVEKVNGDGTIRVSDYNLEWDGAYRVYDRPASGLTYIYF